MTKTDLIAQVAANTEMSKKSAEMAVNAAFAAGTSHRGPAVFVVETSQSSLRDASHSPFGTFVPPPPTGRVFPEQGSPWQAGQV